LRKCYEKREEEIGKVKEKVGNINGDGENNAKGKK
jgi:uncharacterized protein YjbJ (UPF0337 family)